MTAASSINLMGTLTASTGRAVTPMALSQIISELEVKSFELFVPHGATVSVPLTLSAGVTEALVIALYSPYALHLTLTSSDAVTPGPVILGLKGFSMLTLAPGEGIAAITAKNADTTQDTTLQVLVGAAQAAGDVPAFWT